MTLAIRGKVWLIVRCDKDGTWMIPSRVFSHKPKCRKWVQDHPDFTKWDSTLFDRGYVGDEIYEIMEFSVE